jgi:hypothetical protein
VTEKITEGREASLYRFGQLSDALNTIIPLILVVRLSSGPLCLNRLGSNPLEHCFGRTRTQCHDVNTMARMLGAFIAEILSHSVDVGMDLPMIPHRRFSFGMN